MYYGDEKFCKIKTFFTIHNIEYQGKFGMDTYGSLFGFPNSILDFVEYNGCVNLMKGAIEMSDIVTTVSPTYAQEIKHAFFAHGLEDVIKRNEHKLAGILNGIDLDYYNPETDKCLFANYSVKVPFSVFVITKVSSSSPVSGFIYVKNSISSIFPWNS